MAFDRTRFKAAKLEANKAESQKVEKTLKVGSSSRGDYHTIDEGTNLFRIFPPHNPEDPSFQAKAVYWLEVKLPKLDSDKNVVEGQFEWAKRPIFDSRIHGGTSKDIIDEYIKFTSSKVYESFDKEESKKQLAPIRGWRSKDGKWNPGITVNSSYVCYATKGEITIPNIGRLELYQNDKEQLEKLNVDQESGEVIQTDIWSGPNDGIQFVLSRQRNKDGKFENTISKRSFSPKSGVDPGQAWKDFVESQVIPDDVLEHWSKMEPLVSQFKNAYKRSDFTRAVEGLQKFDQDNGFNTFDNDEFLDIVQEIDSYYPEFDETDESETKSTPSKSEHSEVKSLNDMTRDELKAYIAKHNLGIKVLASMPVEVIVASILEVESEQKDELSEGENPIKDEDPKVDPLPQDLAPTPTTKSDAAAALRERLANRK